jgi:hypothetical protein
MTHECNYFDILFMRSEKEQIGRCSCVTFNATDTEIIPLTWLDCERQTECIKLKRAAFLSQIYTSMKRSLSVWNFDRSKRRLHFNAHTSRGLNLQTWCWRAEWFKIKDSQQVSNELYLCVGLNAQERGVSAGFKSHCDANAFTPAEHDKIHYFDVCFESIFFWTSHRIYRQPVYQLQVQPSRAR